MKNRKEQKVEINLLIIPKKNDLDNKTSVLAAWELCINHVSAHVTPNEVMSISDDRHFFTKILPSRYVKQAKMSINVSMAKFNVSHIAQKRYDIIVQMDTVCSWINRFQEHPYVQKDDEYMIDANMTCSDGAKMSLLHAAVILYDSKQIDYLLCLEADMFSKSNDCRTTFDLAKHLHKQAYDRNNPKLENRFQRILQDLKMVSDITI